MKSFLTRTVIIGFLLSISLLIVYSAVDFFGFSDFAYKRVVSKEDGSLIVGTSRAAQALQPAIMNPILSEFNYLPVYNFAFTITDSPFGEVYFSAISKKLDSYLTTSSARLFVVCVDPFSLSSIEELDEKGLRDEKGILSGIPGFSKPNYYYLVKNFKPKEWAEMRTYECLHDDGWLEILVDSTTIGRNKQERLALYRNYTVCPSQERIAWLVRTIEFLRDKGVVFLCRLSTCSEMNEIEDGIWPGFDIDMKAVADRFDIKYISFFNDFDKYRTIDGNHIYREDGKLISMALCDSILRTGPSLQFL